MQPLAAVIASTWLFEAVTSATNFEYLSVLVEEPAIAFSATLRRSRIREAKVAAADL